MPAPRTLFFLAALTLSAAAADPKPAPIVDRIRFQPTPGTEKDWLGATLSGSNTSRTEGFTPLGEIKAPIKAGEWNELKLPNNTQVYRWLRFTSPGVIKGGRDSKLEFYAGEHLLAGSGKGGFFTPFAPDPTPDGAPAEKIDDRTIGYEITEGGITAARPNIQPAQLDRTAPTEVKITSSTGATIRYTLDGTWPRTPADGLAYTAPFRVEKTTTISAVAFQEGRAPSLPTTVTYLFKTSDQSQLPKALVTAHLGNSLTGTTGQFYRYARTAGIDHHSSPFLRPGALTRELWALASGEYTADKLASAKEQQAQGRGNATWQDYYAKVGQIDALTLQPRDFDLEKELAAEVKFINLFREKSPDLQPWLYAEWVEMRRSRPSDRGEVPSYQMAKTFPALTWEESMGAMLLYVEELQHRLTPMLPAGTKRPRIIPSSLAMGWIKNLIDHGQLPGIQPGTFYSLLFNDQVHPADGPIHGSANGGYLVDMTWFSALYRQPAAGHVLPVETTFTPAQLEVINRLTWDVIKNYPDCGLYEEGTTPCAPPEFKKSEDGKTITLTSKTPNTWFRYTLDGTEPTRTRGYVYCGTISVQPGIQLKAVAYKSGNADSSVSAPPASL